MLDTASIANRSTISGGSQGEKPDAFHPLSDAEIAAARQRCYAFVCRAQTAVDNEECTEAMHALWWRYARRGRPIKWNLLYLRALKDVLPTYPTTELPETLRAPSLDPAGLAAERDRVNAFLHILPPEQLSVAMCLLAGATGVEIAAAEGVTKQAIACRVRSIRAAWRRFVEAQG